MLIDIIKTSLRVTTDKYDDEISMHINSAIQDLGLAGILNFKLGTANLDPMIIQAISLYTKAHFSRTLPDEYDGLLKAYEGIKSRLRIADGFADWSA